MVHSPPPSLNYKLKIIKADIRDAIHTISLSPSCALEQPLAPSTSPISLPSQASPDFLYSSVALHLAPDLSQAVLQHYEDTDNFEVAAVGSIEILDNDNSNSVDAQLSPEESDEALQWDKEFQE